MNAIYRSGTGTTLAPISLGVFRPGHGLLLISVSPLRYAGEMTLIEGLRLNPCGEDAGSLRNNSLPVCQFDPIRVR